MSKCEKCLYYKTKQKCYQCRSSSNVVDNYPAFTPNTNYDRIRNMSIVKLTAFITKLAFFPCELCEREHNASCTYEDCFNIHKQWLEQEVEE